MWHEAEATSCAGIHRGPRACARAAGHVSTYMAAPLIVFPKSSGSNSYVKLLNTFLKSVEQTQLLDTGY